MDGPFDPGDTYDEVGPDGRIHLGPPETGGDYFEDPQGNRRYFDDGDGEVTLPPPTYGPPPPAGKAPSGGIGARTKNPQKQPEGLTVRRIGARSPT